MGQLKEVKVGDTLFVRGGYRADDITVSEQIVTKVGRKWVSAGRNDKFCIETGVIDSGGYTPRFTAYRSREDMDKRMARSSKEDDVIKIISRTFSLRLSNLSDADLETLTTILRSAQVS